MFRKLTTFSYVRSTKEAIGFFITYTVLLIVLKMAVGLTTGIVVGNPNPEPETVLLASQIGDAAVALLVMLLCFSILERKHRLGALTILGTIAAAIVAVITGPLLAAFVPALLTRLRLPEGAISTTVFLPPVKRQELVPGAVAVTIPAIPSTIYPSPLGQVSR